MLLKLTSVLEALNTVVNSFVWGPVMLSVFLFTGLLFSVRSGFFQIRCFRKWMSSTIITTLTKKTEKNSHDKHAITPFQSLCTALAATIGTGNITGVATALVCGGPGAIFWMWISALLGMMTIYAEISLGLKYRFKNKLGEWVGGPMFYIERGLGIRWLAIMFAICCTLASFGMGNMAQANSIAVALDSSFSLHPLYGGILIAILCGVVTFGGIRRIATFTEKLVPFMAILYIAGSLIIIFSHFTTIPYSFALIVKEAFNTKAAAGGVVGYGIMQAMKKGISRGVFSNEAGLGSSVMIHISSDTKSAHVQGMWGIFEVFTDTLVMCTLTALAIMTSGAYDFNLYSAAYANASVNPLFSTLPNGVTLTINAFSSVFGRFGGTFISISVVLFAFSTLVGWSLFGERSVQYLLGQKAVPVYKLIFILLIIPGSCLGLNLVWDISDTLNGLMAIPNLIALLLLSREITMPSRKNLPALEREST